MSQDTILITGACGFIGTHLAQFFKQRGFFIAGIDRQTPENSDDFDAFLEADLPTEELTGFLQALQPAFCIHAAGNALVSASMSNPSMDFHSSISVTFHLLDTLRQYSPFCRFIFLSSAAVYGNPDRLPVLEDTKIAPLSPYGYHKYLCEQLCEEYTRIYRMNTAIARIFSAYGPGLRKQVVWDICQKVITSQDVSASIPMQGTGLESRDFIHVLDIAQALLLILQQAPMQAEIYNLASEHETTIQELTTTIFNLLGFQGEARFNGETPIGTPQHWHASIDKIKALGFTPQVSLRNGLNDTVLWCKQNALAALKV